MSENYRALTRTYRPTTFDEIVSQTHVSETLQNAIKQNRLAHAYMFCGPRGVGKTTMARVLARTVNDIDAGVDGEALNQTLNVVEIDAASNNSVDDIRDLRERVRIPPQNGRFKIYIIDEVHMLSKAAFNALLKTLEEPPEHIIFIFATTEPHKVLPTILSRVQRFDFKRLRVDEIVGRLRMVANHEKIDIDNESLHVIAKKADGAMRDALGLLDQAIAFCGSDIQYEELLKALNVVSTERMFEFMDTVESHDAGRGLDLINDVLQEGYDIQEFLIGLTEHLRNLYIAKDSGNMHLVEASEETRKRYRESSEGFSQDDLIRMMHIVSEAQFKIKDAHQPRIQFEITLLKLIHMERTENLDKLLSGLEELKKKMSGLNGREKTPDPETVNDNDRNTPANDRSNQNGSSAGDTHPEGRQTASSPSNETVNPDQESEISVAEEPAQTFTEEEVHDDELLNDFFGRPSLDKYGETRNKSNGSTRTEQAPVTKPAKKPSEFTLEDIREAWEPYLETLKREVPQMLYFQMTRIDPVKLSNAELVLRCNDDFAKKIIEENKRELAKVLEGTIGVFLRFSCVVKKNRDNDEESMSPYERFKRLQRRDPKIKMLVELFGAELDYNLSQ